MIATTIKSVDMYKGHDGRVFAYPATFHEMPLDFAIDMLKNAGYRLIRVQGSRALFRRGAKWYRYICAI